MSKHVLPNVIKRLQGFIKKNSSDILIVIGITGMISTTVMAVTSTPKALILIEKKKKELDTETLKPVDLIKTTWKCYITSAITGALSTACIIGANSINTKRNAALATANSLAITALKDYREKAVEIVGDKKEQAIRDAVAKEKIEAKPIGNQEVIVTAKGNTLCFDVLSGRYFKSDIDKIKKVENDLNRQMRDAMYISLNEFYYELGLERINLGDDLGWNIDKGYIDLSYSSQLADDGTPCLVVDYNCPPQYGYQLFM